MANLHELIDSLTDENVEELKEQLRTEADALHKSNKSLYTRAKKAEGFEYDKTKKDWVKPVKKEEPKPEAKKSDGPDYSKALENSNKALLNSLGFTNSDDQKYILEQSNRLGIEVTDVVNDGYFKSKLKEASDQREAQSGAPKGKGKAGGSNTSSDVDYWVAKGEAPEDLELAEKYFETREKKERMDNMFSDDMYTDTSNTVSSKR